MKADEIKTKVNKALGKFLNHNRGMVGIEAAIVLISFVIVAAAFSFMVVNMGLFATQRGRETIQNGILEATSPLVVDGTIMCRANSTGNGVDAMVVPLKTMGTREISIGQNGSEISLRIENHAAYANIYYGINSSYSPLNTELSTLVDAVKNTTSSKSGAQLFIGNTDGDSSLDYDEKGYLVFYFASSEQAAERDHIFVEIRPEKGAPLSVEFIVPPQLKQGWLTIGS